MSPTLPGSGGAAGSGGRAGTGFAFDRRTVRLMLYASLLLCDLLAIWLGFVMGVIIRGKPWMLLHGVPLAWYLTPLHIMIGLGVGAFARGAVESRFDSIQRGIYALLVSTGLVLMLVFFEQAGDAISRVGVGVSLVFSLGAIAGLRFMFLSFFPRSQQGWLTGELLIVDGAGVPRGYHGDVLDVRAETIEPDVQDAQQLGRLAEWVTPYDRVIVASATAQRRGQWAQMLKCFDIAGEVILDDGTPLGAVAVDRFCGKDTVVVARGPLSLGARISKRSLDVAISGAALLFLLPLLLLTAAAIKLDSRGPVFFAQTRVGRGNRLFRILKFRSMRIEASDLDGNLSTARDDARVTRLGRIIRGTSIDELPQLINVLKGDMSIVGPRPHALGSLAGDKLFWQVDDAYWRRHALRPGITGLAQVRGFRGATHKQLDLENRLQSDLEYVNGWSLWSDVKIIFATFRVIVHPQAY